MTDEGGGASRSTDPAAGSSAATDISLREYTARDLWWLDRHYAAEIAAVRRESATANKTAERAITVASVEAKERLDQHNGLIGKMENQAGTFVSRDVLDEFKSANDSRVGRIERLIFMAMGGLFLVGLVGIANLVKVWSG